jgi:6-phosphogluconate dehydrogenase
MAGIKPERVAAEQVLSGPEEGKQVDNVAQMIQDIRQALYASKICSYAQGMKILFQASQDFEWDLNLGTISRIWKGGCIIRAVFLDRIKAAYDRNPKLTNLLVDPEFSKELIERQAAWRRVVIMAVERGIAVPALSGSLAYFDAYRRGSLPANLTQAQRDFFGAHTFKRTDKPHEQDFHAHWEKSEE